MPEQIEQIVAILHKLLHGVALSDTEKEILNAWVSRSAHNKELYDQIINDPDSLKREVQAMMNYRSATLWKKINRRLPGNKYNITSIFRSRPIRFAAAAAVLILLAGAYFIFIYEQRTTNIEPPITSNQPSNTDIPPGSDGAVLTLSDGKQIILDNTGKGEIAQEGDARVIKSEDGQLVYQLSGKNHPGETRFNTVRTPRGKQYSIVLPDGSKVWLNSASSIHYPAVFSGNERRVTVTGELYFDIAKDKSKPFRVAIASGEAATPSPLAERVGVRRGEIEVLGTQFNLNAYSDEPSITTTLVEGLVKISAGGKNSFIKPGQQGRISSPLGGGREGALTILNNVDLVKATAWKNGVFSFDDDIETVMRQIARWYDVDIVFKDKINYHVVATTIPKNITVLKLLHLLQLTDQVRFKVEGKKIIVER